MATSSIGSSSIDVNAIVAQLMQVESRPITVLQSKEAAILAKVSAYGTVKSSLSSFQNAVGTLSKASTFSSLTAASADATVVAASASSIASAGNYNVTVNALAQAQSLSSSGQASTISSVGGGTATTISFQFGSISGGALAAGKYTGAAFTADATVSTKSVVIDSSNNSLQGIRDAINKAGVGVTASLVNDGAPGTPFHLLLTSTATGLARSMKISSDGADAAVTALLAYDPAATQNFTQTAVAQNASVTVNGLAVSSATNTVSDAIAGVTLNLAKAGATTVSVANNTASVASAIQALVKSYNDTNTTLKTMTGYNPTTKKGGILLGDSTIQSIQSKLRATFASALTGTGSSALTNVTQIGVAFQKDGTLTLDNAKLQTALSAHFDDFSALFAATGKATDSLVTFAGSSSATTPGSYALEVSTLATRGKAAGVTRSTSLAASSAPNLTIGAGNEQLSVSIDGGAALAVTLTAGVYADAATLALQVTTDINSALATAGQSGRVSVTDSGGKLGVASTLGATGTVAVNEDSGSPGNTGAASLLGTPVRSSTISAGVNDQLTVSISGTSATVTLPAGTYADSALSAQLQSAINANSTFSGAGIAVSVERANDLLSVTSTRYGATSAVNITGGSGFANLFSSLASATVGVDVAGKINGVTATGSGQYLSAASGDAAEGMKLQIVGGATGARGVVNFSQGYAYLLNQTIDGVLSTKGPLASNTDSANRNIAALQKRAKDLNVQLTITERRYRAQFTSLDLLTTKLQQTSSFLSQQLANLPSSTG
jgi:flagellar hook-associated protein 2